MKLKPQHRTFGVEKNYTIDEENRKAEFTFSSEVEYEREWGIEILDHSEGAVSMERVETNSLPLLLNHDPDKQIGIIEKVWIDPTSRVGRCEVRFSKNTNGQEILNDVADGIRKNVSVGYRINKVVKQGTREDGLGIYRVTDWAPHEISIVSIPADHTIGLRSDTETENEVLIEELETKEVKSMSKEYTDEQIKEIEKKILADATKSERERASGIRAVANNVRHLLPEVDTMIDTFINSERSVAEFQDEVLKRMDKVEKEPIKMEDKTPNIDMTEKEVRNYSIARAINAMLTNDWSKAGLEREASQAVRNMTGREARGVYIPFDVLATRVDAASTTTSANDLVYTDNWGSDYIQLLRNKSVVGQLGARIYAGLTDSISIPKASTGSTAQWVSETNSSSVLTQLSTDAVTMSPKLLYAPMAASKTLLAQAVNPAIDAILREDLNLAISSKIDETALAGASGLTNAPAGVLYTDGVELVSIASPTWSGVVSMETSVAANNADISNAAYVTNSKVIGELKTTAKNATIHTNGYLLEADGTMNGYRVLVTNAMPSNLGAGSASSMLFGNWNDLMVGLWGGIDITVDSVTLAASGGIVLHAHALADIALRRTESFTRSQDIVTG